MNSESAAERIDPVRDRLRPPATVTADPAQRLAGELRLGGSVLRGTRTEWLPFPCHPRDHAFLADLDPTVPVQYWEQRCAANGCGIVYRFEHDGRQIRWHPIVGLTDDSAQAALPLDRYTVEARLRREGGLPMRAPVSVPGSDEPDSVRRPTAGRMTTVPSA